MTRINFLQITSIFTMASNFPCTLALLSLLLLCTSSFQISSVNTLDTTDKVSLGLYYEALCPGSAVFIVHYLPQIFYNGLINIVDLHLSPWGNAKMISNETFSCQHGEVECFLNTIGACAIAVWPDVNTHFLFITCVEEFVLRKKSSEWDTCFEYLGLDTELMYMCYRLGIGTQLELKYANETAALKPPHKYVPWVTVNGKPLEKNYTQFMSYICEAYKGPSRPEACDDLLIMRKPKVSHGENFSRRVKFYPSKEDKGVEAISVEAIPVEDKASAYCING